MTFKLTNISMGKSRNGYSLNCTFLINNTPVAIFDDRGDGGQPSFFVVDNDAARNLFKEWERELENLPEIYVEEYEMTMKVEKDLFIDLLHAAQESKKPFTLLAA